MPVSGKGKRSILFVAEAPGQQEDQSGVQFVGEAGRCLRNILKEIDVDIDDCWKTNSAICRPPNNDITDLHIESCRPNLLNTIRELKPKVIFLLGESAVKSLISTEWGDDLGSIGRWVGWNIPSQTYKSWLCPTYHPSHVLRSGSDPTLSKIVKEHFVRGIARETAPWPDYSLAELSKRVEIFTDPVMGMGAMQDLNTAKGKLAWDYETTGLKPERKEQQIVSVSFCLNGTHTFATAIEPYCFPTLSKVLKNPNLRKIASNMKFEERWTRTKLGHGVAGWDHDTMLASHVLDNRGSISSIKFQTYVNFGVGDYSSSIKPFSQADTANGLNRIREVPIRDVLLYCGLDSMFEYMVEEIQEGPIYGR
jgi:uracil-DNA glycosylase family 4